MALLSVAGAVAALLGLRRMTPATRGGAWALLSATAEQPKGKVGVLGGGCFGTAFAQLMARNGYEVKMWVRNERTRESINADHENPKYLPDCTLSPRVTACDTFAEAVEGAALVAVAIPTPFLRDTFIRNRDVLPRNVPIVLLSKGIENETLLTPIEILREELPGKYSKYICCVSGPSFAKEIAKGLPTNVTCASECEAVATQVQRMVSDRYFKVYTSQDTMGVEYGGALKNVIAIAAGVSDGLGMGCNGRAALITRGLAEITKITEARGGNPMTMLSLAGVGDLLLTCTATMSRNYSVGYRLGKGETLEEVQGSMSEVAEGVKTAKSVHFLAQELGIEVPICEQVYQVLYNGKSLSDAIGELLDREAGVEIGCATAVDGRPPAS